MKGRPGGVGGGPRGAAKRRREGPPRHGGGGRSVVLCGGVSRRPGAGAGGTRGGRGPSVTMPGVTACYGGRCHAAAG